MMTVAPQQFVDAEEFRALQREHAKLQESHTRLHRMTADVQRKSYDEGREDARREYTRTRSVVQSDAGIACLSLPDAGGMIQCFVVGAHGPRPLLGGLKTPSPDLVLRIWGPPDESGSYGVHEQGGGNLTDFSMSFDLTPAGIVVHQMDAVGVRSLWDRADRGE
jgi:hypothetical protein